MKPWRPVFVALLACTLSACGPKSEQGKTLPSAPTTNLWKEFSGERAMEDVRKQVEFGPRPSGTAALEKARGHITETLKAAGWDVERQEFDATPVLAEGGQKFVNLIARFSAGKHPAPANTQKAIVGSHYDTKRMLAVKFVGANDGASSTGALLELARVLAKQPALAEQVELVFFDGEEAVVEFSPDPENGPDGLVGSRNYAHELRTSGRAAQFRFFILLDMIGEKDVQLTIPPGCPQELTEGIYAAGDALGLRQHLGFHEGQILDDHVPMQVIARIPSIDLIDLKYEPWHTAGDTLDKLSPASLEAIGRMTVWLLSRDLAK